MYWCSLILTALIAVPGCTTSTSKVAGGGANAYGTDSIAIGGPAGSGTQIVNITGRDHATSAQRVAISRAVRETLVLLIKHKPITNAAGMNRLYEEAHLVNTWDTPLAFRKAHNELLESIIDYRTYFAKTQKFNPATEPDKMAEWNRQKKRFSDAILGMFSAANESGVDIMQSLKDWAGIT